MSLNRLLARLPNLSSTPVRRLLVNGSWSFLSGTFSKLAPLVVLALVARFLGRESVGLLAFVQTTIVVTGGFVGVGLGMGATRSLADLTNATPERRGGSLILFGTVTLAILLTSATLLSVGSEWFANEVLGEPAIARLLGLSGPLLLFTGCQFFQQGVLAGLTAFRGQAVANFLSGFLVLPCAGVGLYLGNLEAVIGGLTVAACGASLVSGWIIHQEFRALGVRYDWRQAWSQRSELHTFALPCLMLNIVTAPADWICFKLLLSQPGGVNSLGIYAAANQWSVLIRFLPMTFASALLPQLTRHVDDPELKVRNRLVGIGYLMTAAATIPLAGAVVWCSGTVMGWYGPDFAPYGGVLQLLALSGVAIAFQVTIERMLTAFKVIWGGFAVRVCGATSYCLFAVWLVPYGADGLAIARLLSSVILAVSFWLVLRARMRQTKVSPGALEEAAGVEEPQEAPRPRQAA